MRPQPARQEASPPSARPLVVRPERALLGALAAAVALGYLVAAKPGLFHLEISPEPAQLALDLACLALAVWIVRRPAAGLGFLILFVYLNLSQVLVRYHGLPSLLQLLAVPLVIAAWLARGRDGPRAAAALVLTWLLAAHGLVLLFSSTLARFPELADAVLLENLKAFVIYFLVVLLADSPTRLKGAVWTMIGAGSLLAALGLIQVASGNFDNEYGGLARIKNAQIHGDVFEPRIAGPLGDPNFFAQILLILVPLALSLGWSARRRGAKTLAFAAAGLLIAAVVLSYSRGGALALTVVLTLTWIARGIRWRQVAIGAGIAAVLALALPSDIARRLATLEQILPGSQDVLHPDSSFEKRRLVTRVAWQIFLAHFWLGVGAGNYTAEFASYADAVGSSSREYDDPAEPHYPHNLYLEIGAETGLLGLLVFGSVVLAALISLEHSRRRLLSAGERSSAELARGVAIALTGYLVSSLFLHGHFLRYLWLLFALAGALAALAGAAAPKSAPRSPERTAAP